MDNINFFSLFYLSSLNSCHCLITVETRHLVRKKEKEGKVYEKQSSTKQKTLSNNVSLRDTALIPKTVAYFTGTKSPYLIAVADWTMLERCFKRKRLADRYPALHSHDAFLARNRATHKSIILYYATPPYSRERVNERGPIDLYITTNWKEGLNFTMGGWRFGSGEKQ